MPEYLMPWCHSAMIMMMGNNTKWWQWLPHNMMMTWDNTKWWQCPPCTIMMMGNNTRWRRTPLLMKYSNKNLYATNWLHRTLWSWFVHLPKALAKLWFTTFVKTAPCQTWKSLTKTPVSIVSRYCIQPLKRFASNPIAMQYLLQL